MGETVVEKKKGAASYTGHWARPRTHTYEYNYQYSESYYQAQVNYLEKIKSKSSTRMSRATSATGNFAESASRYSRAGSPPRAQTFSERWAANPFYGRLGYRYSKDEYEKRANSTEPEEFSYFIKNSNAKTYAGSRRAVSVSAISSSQKSQSYGFDRETSVRPTASYRSASVSADNRRTRADTEERNLSLDADIRSRRAESEERNFSVAASVERARAMRSMVSSSRDSEEVSSSRFRRALSEPLTRRISEALADTQYVASGESVFPQKRSAADDSYPLGFDAYRRRRFVLGDQYLDAAALGGFDVLYDPSTYERKWRILKRIIEESEEETITRSVREESSSRQLRSYQERAASVLR